MGKAVYKATVNGELRWVHASKRSNTVKLRWFGPSYEKPEVLNLADSDNQQKWRDVSSGERFSVSQIAALTNDVLPFSADDLSVDKDADKWIKVFERLGQLGNSILVNGEGPSATLGVRSPIPQTRMRRFYETMRMLNEAALQKGIAKYLTEYNRADRIQVMFKESEAHFTKFTNVDEPFHNRKNPDWLGAYTDRVDDFARCLVAKLRPTEHHEPIPIAGGSNVRVVDYELSLFRTTGRAIFEDGKAGISSGAGGMDLLLQDSETHIPVIGEIKAATDRDLFLALIQALTYATELTTPSQLARLARHYGSCDFQNHNRHCEILLLYDKRAKLPKLMSETRKLATQLLAEPTSPVARRVRRITAVSADLKQAVGKVLACEWSATSP